MQCNKLYSLHIYKYWRNRHGFDSPNDSTCKVQFWNITNPRDSPVSSTTNSQINDADQTKAKPITLLTDQGLQCFWFCMRTFWETEKAIAKEGPSKHFSSRKMTKKKRKKEFFLLDLKQKRNKKRNTALGKEIYCRKGKLRQAQSVWWFLPSFQLCHTLKNSKRSL